MPLPPALTAPAAVKLQAEGPRGATCDGLTRNKKSPPRSGAGKTPVLAADLVGERGGQA